MRTTIARSINCNQSVTFCLLSSRTLSATRKDLSASQILWAARTFSSKVPRSYSTFLCKTPEPKGNLIVRISLITHSVEGNGPNVKKAPFTYGFHVLRQKVWIVVWNRNCNSNIDAHRKRLLRLIDEKITTSSSKQFYAGEAVNQYFWSLKYLCYCILTAIDR